jgi:hypothetical protein
MAKLTYFHDSDSKLSTELLAIMAYGKDMTQMLYCLYIKYHAAPGRRIIGGIHHG